MALSRLGNRNRPGDFTWPGFVDALASLLMVFVFVLMVFVLIQANLAYRLSGQDASLSELRRELSMLGELLSLERDASLALSADLSRTQSQLANTQQLLSSTQDELAKARTALDDANTQNNSLAEQLAAVTAQLGLSRQQSETLQSQLSDTTRANANLEQALASRTADNQALSDKLEISEDQLAQAIETISSQQARLAELENRLADANRTIDTTSQKLTEEKNLTANAKREVDELTTAMQTLQAELTRLRGLLDDKKKEAIKDKIAIANLGKELNNALANKVQELQNFRSEFFGRVREVLKDRSDVQIVGDRFIFQSEVLFAPGQASIGEAGQQQLSQIATALIEITTTIPADIPWLLQVDGHTDNIPIAGQYKDNWDLSTERALSVVRLMIEQGVPPQRLSAAGYGEFQPVSEGDTELDRQKNRRIELKLTQRLSSE
ncbi:MAG: OmpA family protein [Pseudomonadota bacterium]|jgi:chemotaxis protein MotB|nr:OmpA family protein [Pseudomonadota bacterium]